MSHVSKDTAARKLAPVERLPPDRVLRWAEVKELVGVSRSTWWRMVRAGAAPASRRIGTGCAGWLESEIVTFLRDLPSYAEAVECA